MAQVSFYVMQQAGEVDLFACRLCRRVGIAANTPLFVCFSTSAQMQAFDELLWGFEASSFVPHAIDDATAPVCLGLTPPDDFAGCCLNLSDHAVDVNRFERVLEIIGNDDDAKARGRLRYQAYRKQQLEIETFYV